MTPETDAKLQDAPNLQTMVSELQQQLADAQTFQQTLFNALDDAVLIVEIDTRRIIDANRTAADKLGYSVAELRTMTLNNLEVYANGRMPTSHLYRHKHGAMMPVTIHTEAFTVDDRTLNYHFIRDVKDYGHQEKLKRLHEVNLAIDTAETVDDVCQMAVSLGLSELGFDRLGIWLFGPRQKRVYGMFGTDEHGYIRDERKKRFDPQQIASLVDATKSRSQVAYNADAPLYDDSHNVVGQGWTASAALWDGTSIIGFINADNLISRTPVDMNDLEVLKLYGATLGYMIRSKRSDEKVRKLSRAVEQSSSLVVITDTTGIIEYVNPKFTDVTGYTYDEAIGKNPRILKSGTKAREEYASMWQAITAGNEWIGEFHNKKKNGELYWALASISPIKNHDGQVTHFVAVQEDITQRKMAERQQVELAIEREKVDLLAEFITDVAHEFRTPLSVINASSYILHRRLKSEPQIDRHLDTIKAQASYIDDLVAAMLTLVRLDREVEPSYDLVNLETVLHNIVVNAIDATEKQGKTLQTQFAAIPSIKGNEQELFVGIAEVVKNAIEFTNDNEGEILVMTEAHPSTVHIMVKDNGIGIDAKSLPYIFDRFYRGDQARTTRGAGLGLSIAKKIFDMHQGQVEVASEPGKGTTFTIIFPKS